MVDENASATVLSGCLRFCTFHSSLRIQKTKVSVVSSIVKRYLGFAVKWIVGGAFEIRRLEMPALQIKSFIELSFLGFPASDTLCV